MPFILPAAFVDHVAALADPETADLAALCSDAPFAYLDGTDRRVSADVYQGARLRELARTIGGLQPHHLNPLKHAADWAAQHPRPTT